MGRPIDGSDDGQPGGDYVATISVSRATDCGIPLARTERHPARVADVVDHLLARGELSRLRAKRQPGPEYEYEYDQDETPECPTARHDRHRRRIKSLCHVRDCTVTCRRSRSSHKSRSFPRKAGSPSSGNRGPGGSTSRA